jgi:hypothetical protein
MCLSPGINKKSKWRIIRFKKLYWGWGYQEILTLRVPSLCTSKNAHSWIRRQQCNMSPYVYLLRISIRHLFNSPSKISVYISISFQTLTLLRHCGTDIYFPLMLCKLSLTFWIFFYNNKTNNTECVMLQDALLLIWLSPSYSIKLLQYLFTALRSSKRRRCQAECVKVAQSHVSDYFWGWYFLGTTF